MFQLWNTYSPVQLCIIATRQLCQKVLQCRYAYMQWHWCCKTRKVLKYGSNTRKILRYGSRTRRILKYDINQSNNGGSVAWA